MTRGGRVPFFGGLMSVHSVSETPTGSARFSRGGKIRAILALGAVVGIGSVLTLAAWTDDSTASATFSTGSIDIKLDTTNEGNPAAYSFAALSMSGMKDGSVKYGGLVVNNAGTLDFTYTMATSFTGDSGLAGALRISVKTIGSAETCTQTTYDAGTSLVAPVAVGNTFAISTGRLISTGGNENLCFKIELPSGSANGVQAKTVNASLAFTATQIP